MAASNLNLFVKIQALVQGSGEIKKFANEVRGLASLARAGTSGFGQGFVQGAKEGIASLRGLRSEALNTKGSMAGIGDDLTKGLTLATAASRGLLGALLPLAGAVAAALSFKKIIDEGVQFNKTMEDATLGIASLVTALGTIKDAQGVTLTGQDALTAAITLSKEQMLELRKAGLSTAATTQQLVEAYQVAIGPGLAAGLNLEDTRKVTIQVTQAATALGVPLQQISQETRAILSGNIDINARVAQSLGLTGEQVRLATKQGKLVELLNEKMEAFGVAAAAASTSFSVLASNAQETFSVFSGDVTSTFFENVKGGLVALNSVLDPQTLGVSAKYKEIVELLREGIGSLGTLFSDVVTSSLSALETVSTFIRENSDGITEIGLIFNEIFSGISALLDPLLSAARDLLGLFFESGSALDTVKTILYAIATILAGIQDGARVISVGFQQLGAVIIASVAVPLTGILDLLSLIGKFLGISVGGVERLSNSVKRLGAETIRDAGNAGRDLATQFANGESAVAKLAARMKQLPGEAAKLNAQKRESARIDAQAEARLKRQQGVGGRSFTLSGKAKPTDTKAGSAAKDARDAARAEADFAKQVLAAQEAELERSYARQEITVEKFYDTKEQIIRDRFEIERKLIDSDPDNKNKDTAKLTLLLKEGEAIEANTEKLRQQRRSADEARGALQQAVLALQGDNVGAESLRIEAQYQKYIELANTMEEANKRAVLALAESFKSISLFNAVIDKQKRDFAQAEDRRLAEADLARSQRGLDGSGDLQTDRKVREDRNAGIRDQIAAQERQIAQSEQLIAQYGKETEANRNLSEAEEIRIIKAKAAINDLKATMADNTAFQQLADSFKSALDAVLIEGQSFGDALKGLFKSVYANITGDITKEFSQNISNSIKSILFNSQSSSGGGGIGGFFSSFLGSIFGGFRAAGGSVEAGMLYQVNERRPEVLSYKGNDFLMMGSSGGTVQANPRMRGGGGVTNINVNVPANTGRDSASQTAASVAERLQVAGSRNN